ncbi:MAG TPA: GNAT family N-acetyltransferase [Burkholderiaceae bacterium]
MTAADLPAVMTIQAASHSMATVESRESLQAKLSASPSTCLTASLEDSVVGYLISLPWEFAHPPVLNAPTCQLPASPNCLHLHDLAVTPRARQFGAGRTLVQALLTQAETRNLERASLISVRDSAPYWRRHGFRAVPQSERLKAILSTYGDGVVYMERALDPSHWAGTPA